MLTIAIDAMGGDHGPEVTVPAALRCLESFDDLRIVLVGDQPTLLRELYRQPPYAAGRLWVRHAPQVVGMDEAPAQALRNRLDSSLGIALQLVAQNAAAACISAGNTGAIMALGCKIIGTFEGIRRPAICAAIPTRDGHCHVLDLGANVNSSARQLVQFALMGSTLVSVAEGFDRPRVALLNVGAEASKGNAQVREAGERLRMMHELRYVGFVEGHDLFRDAAEVIVCDGFVGNITLKASEELLRMMSGLIIAGFQRNWFARLVGGLTRWVLGGFRRQMDPARNNGASLLGLRRTVVKSHGAANVESFVHAIETAVTEARRDLPGRIQQQLARSRRAHRHEGEADPVRRKVEQPTLRVAGSERS